MNRNSTSLSKYVTLIRALDNALSVGEIFDSVAELSHCIVPSNRASITTFLEDEKTLEAKALYDDDPDTPLNSDFRFSIKGNRSDYIEHALVPKIWCPADKLYNHPAQDLNEIGMRSIMNVPLLSDQQFIGTLNLGSKTRIFQPDDLTELRQIAALVGISLDKFADLTRVRATSRRYLLYAQQLEHLNTLGEQLLQVSTIEQALEKVKLSVSQLVGARRVSFITLEPDAKSVKIKALVGDTTDLPGQIFPLEDSGLAESLVDGKTQFIPELKDAQHVAHRSLGQSGLSHLWAFPIKRGLEIAGVLTIATERTALASEEATAILGTLSRLLEATLLRVHARSTASQPEKLTEQHHRKDALTGLPNRDVFREHLNYWIKHCEYSGAGFGIMLIDLDHFKDFNHYHGYSIGDRVLASLTNRITQLLRSSDFIARVGGDEFMVLLPMTSAVEHLENTARRVLEALNAPIETSSDFVNVKASIGISRYPEDGRTVLELIEHTDIAMYRAKELGGNQYESFTHELTHRLSHKLKIEQYLKNADKNEEFSLMYQPVIDAESRTIKSVEALLRWNHPKEGFIPPDTFIPIAESNGTIQAISDWVMETGLKAISALQSQFPGLRVAINLSATEFSDKHSLYERVLDALNKTGTKPALLELELTETALLNHPEESNVLVNKLRKLGVRIAIDDFGTGYASLTYLVDLPINTIKIDRSFVDNVNHELRKQVVVSGIIAMANSLDLTCIAEGVETEEQLDWIQEAGCNHLQGYLFSRPVVEETLREYLHQYKESDGLGV